METNFNNIILRYGYALLQLDIDIGERKKVFNRLQSNSNPQNLINSRY